MFVDRDFGVIGGVFEFDFDIDEEWFFSFYISFEGEYDVGFVEGVCGF